MFKTKTPTVRLFEMLGDGAAFSWNGEEARSLALEMFVELARRLEQQNGVQRLRLSGLTGVPIDVADVETFAREAVALLNQENQAYEFDFRINDGERRYSLRHLDQGTSGITFHAPVGGELFSSTLGEVFSDYKTKRGNVTVSTAPWFPDESPKR
jgi:hypothetical protein